MFPIRIGLKQGDALSPLIFNLGRECAFRTVQVNQDGLKLNGTHHLLVYVDDFNILGEACTEALVVTIKENGLVVSNDKTKYMVMSQDQNAR
jgi:hypothetical protein